MRKLTWNIFILNFSIHSGTVQFGTLLIYLLLEQQQWLLRRQRFKTMRIFSVLAQRGAINHWQYTKVLLHCMYGWCYRTLFLFSATDFLLFIFSNRNCWSQLADIFFPRQSLQLSVLQILSCLQGRAVNPRTPEHAGVNYSTPELFWGWVEEIPNPEHKFWLLSCIFSPKCLN